jgi:hypothetical protein
MIKNNIASSTNPQPRTNQKVSGSRARARLLPFLEKMTEQKQKIVSKNGRSNDR